jgi:hypothetical protein
MLLHFSFFLDTCKVGTVISAIWCLELLRLGGEVACLAGCLKWLTSAVSSRQPLAGHRPWQVGPRSGASRHCSLGWEACAETSLGSCMLWCLWSGLGRHVCWEEEEGEKREGRE